MRGLICDHCNIEFKSTPIYIAQCNINICIEHIENDANFKCHICSNSSSTHKKYLINENILFELNKKKFNNKLNELFSFGNYLVKSIRKIHTHLIILRI